MVNHLADTLYTKQGNSCLETPIEPNAKNNFALILEEKNLQITYITAKNGRIQKMGLNWKLSSKTPLGGNSRSIIA